MTDWYQTKTAKKVGFTGRPVIGGVFPQMLYDKAVWAKYAGRDQTKAPGLRPHAQAAGADRGRADGRGRSGRSGGTRRRSRPTAGSSPDFDDSKWKEGKSGFGTHGTPGAIVGTEWNTPNIWLRREFTLPETKLDDVSVKCHHDEDVEIYINGVLAASASGYTTEYELLPLNAAGRAAFRPGKNVIAVHCKQTGGGQYIDVGFARAVKSR